MFPTKEQILLMPAGREMDALVGKFVMGLNVKDEWNRCWNDPESGVLHIENEVDMSGFGVELHPVYLPVYEHSEDSIDFCEPVPFYSTKIEAAWGVIEKITKSLHEIIPERGNELWGSWTLDRLGYDCCKDGKPDVDNAHGQYRCWLATSLSEEKRLDVHTTADTAPLAICRAVLLAKLGYGVDIEKLVEERKADKTQEK